MRQPCRSRVRGSCGYSSRMELPFRSAMHSPIDRSSVHLHKTGFRDLSEGALCAGLSNRALDSFIRDLEAFVQRSLQRPPRPATTCPARESHALGTSVPGSQGAAECPIWEEAVRFVALGDAQG